MPACPILAAGSLVGSVEGEELWEVYQVECIREACEWFENGCPAHPKPKEAK